QKAAYRDYKWASNRARYEYNENALDENGMAPRDETLEKELFENNEQQGAIDFSKYAKIPVKIERGSAPPPIRNFDEADLHPVMKENVRLAGYTNPTPVQTYSIPIVTGGKDLMACAQTGKNVESFYVATELAKPRPPPYETRAYRAEPLVLIVAPTRELCSQIFDECRKFTYRSSLRPCAVYGGADTFGQLRQLERGCDVLAAAPGRLMDFIDRGKIGLERVKYLVLDEADRMLDMGFEAIIRNIVQKKGMGEHQTLLYSATFPRAIRALARDFLRPDYLFLKVGRVGGTSSSITQKIMFVNEEEKREKLQDLLNGLPPSRTLIFVETKRSADSLDQFLYERKFPSTSIHGDRTQMEREDALLAFKSDQIAPDITKLLKECQQEIPDFLQQYVTDDMVFDEDLDDAQVEAPTYANQEYIPMERNVPNPPAGAADGAFEEGGDWNCPSCSASNFARRSECFKCHTPKEGGEGGNGSFGGGSGARDGDWNCTSCDVSNYARRTECFKCNEPRPEGAGGGFGGGGERRPPRPRRDGDWDCPSCSAVNFASRSECFKCSASKEGGEGGFGGDGGYGGDSSYGNYNQPADTGASTFESTDWNAASAGGGWGGTTNDAPAAQESTGEWGGTAPAAQESTGGWGDAAPAAPAAQESTGGWGGGAPAAPAAQESTGGWGNSASAAPAAPASQPASGGWGNAAPAAPAAQESTGGWGGAASAPAAAQPASGGWAPAGDAGGWGSTPAQPTDGGGWGAAPAQAPGAG
ncbi:hypothetical protein CU098_003520, partial [Rhizopus stolonifer]